MQWYVTRQAQGSFQPSTRSAPTFLSINDTHGILFGGFKEHISYQTGQNHFYNDVYILDATNPDLINWIKIDPAPGSPVPIERVFSSAVFYQADNSLYIYAGLNYSSSYSYVTLFDDAWKFSLDTRVWTQLEAHAPPGERAAMTTDIIQETGIAYLTYGVKDVINGFQADVWTWNLNTNVWTQLTITGDKPGSRAIHTFTRIPDTSKFLFLDGVSFVNNSRRGGFDDVWIFDSSNNQWDNLTVVNQPATRNAFTPIMTSPNWFFMHGGHIFTNQTIAQNCLPPLSPCNADATSTDESYFLQLKTQHQETIANWQDEANLEHTTPPLRRSSAILLKPFVYLFGGMGWDGFNGDGELYNYPTWGIQLKEKYFQ